MWVHISGKKAQHQIKPSRKIPSNRLQLRKNKKGCYDAANIVLYNRCEIVCCDIWNRAKWGGREELQQIWQEGACSHFLCRMWPSLTLHCPPGVLSGLNHLVPKLHFLRAAYYSKWQMALRIKKKQGWYPDQTPLHMFLIIFFSGHLWAN